MQPLGPTLFARIRLRGALVNIAVWIASEVLKGIAPILALAVFIAAARTAEVVR